MELPIKCCLCGDLFVSDQPMLQCNVCNVRFHEKCVATKEYTSIDIDKFHCPRCEEEHGSTLMKIKSNFNQQYQSELHADPETVKTGTSVFISELKSRHFSRPEDIIKHLRGQQLTVQYLQTNGFEMPIIVDTKEGLELVLPPPNFSVYDVESYIGGDREMDVIDVVKQNNVRMTLKEFVEYFNDPYRSKILNLISLEFTNTSLSTVVEAPYIARKLDWVNYAWPHDWPEDHELKKPEVQKYCLISAKDSFTDFHIDFGGTSVWYHVFQGEKIFYLVKPTQANLHLYQQWMCSSTQNETFFGDQVDACYKCVLKQGQTMFIPTGWIHAVLTPVDSLVFGGNFLHSLNIPMQIQIYEMERKMKTPAKFQYPGFETIHWFAAKRLLKELKDLNSEDKKCPLYFLQGVKALLSILKQWNTDKDYNMISRGQIPEVINSSKLLKDLSKEIRHSERFLIALNPPKPERESKRNKKKPVNKDFVTYNAPDRTVVEDSKVKSLAKQQSVKKESILVKDPIVSKHPVKLTLSKSTTYPYLKTGVPAAAKQPHVNFASPVKTIKTLSPKLSVPKSKKTGDDKIPTAKTVKAVSNTKKTSSLKKKGSTVSKKGSKSEKQSPTVIRFRLGDKEVVRNTKDKGNNIYGNFTLDYAIATRKELTWKQTTSVYDFHDGSNESDYGGFTIDEAPKRKRVSKTNKKVKRLCEGTTLDEANSPPKNGIEELLKASVYTLGAGTPKLDPAPAINPALINTASIIHPAPTSTGSDRASPSTRDAIAGMLSFSAQCYPITSETPPVKPVKLVKLKSIIEENDNDHDDLLIENMDKVHQDDDFIYPALDISDEDEFTFKSKGKREEDEAWNPKARVGPLLPKVNRPAREGAKKTSVEKGLEAAARKKSKQQGTKTSTKVYKKKQKDQVPAPTVAIKATTEIPAVTRVTSTEPFTSTSDSSPSVIPSETTKHIPYTSILTSPNRLNDVKAKLAAPVPIERKSKKGMKTAKQRLGKILKIHKMLH